MTEKISMVQRDGPRVPCCVLIGMPGAGKTTLGAVLAQKLGWQVMDSDHLIEAIYGRCLQDITDELGKEAFLDLESTVIQSIRAHRLIISTGGSVVYREQAMRHLASLGPLVHLHIPLEIVEERVARNPNRGIAIAPGQTMADLFAEREGLYARWAKLRCDCSSQPPGQCADWILERLPEITAFAG